MTDLFIDTDVIIDFIIDRQPFSREAAQEFKRIDVIITSNIKDYKKSSLPIMTPETFMKTYEQTSSS